MNLKAKMEALIASHDPMSVVFQRAMSAKSCLEWAAENRSAARSAKYAAMAEDFAAQAEAALAAETAAA